MYTFIYFLIFESHHPFPFFIRTGMMLITKTNFLTNKNDHVVRYIYISFDHKRISECLSADQNLILFIDKAQSNSSFIAVIYDGRFLSFLQLIKHP